MAPSVPRAREQERTRHITQRVHANPFQRTGLAERIVQRLVVVQERRQRVVSQRLCAKVPAGLFTTAPVDQQRVSASGRDDMIDEIAHRPLRAWRRVSPLIVSHEPQASLELSMRHVNSVEMIHLFPPL